VDIGTTSTKAEAFRLDGVSVGQASAVTAWSVGRHGETDMDVEILARDVIALLAESATQCGEGVEVAAIGITGLAETGVVIDAHGRPRHPAMAWFDQRGAEELLQMPEAIQASFPGVTGLALKAECSLSKLLWLRTTGLVFDRGDRWLNAQEFVAMRLTGVIASEPSLASRTGLLEQQTGRPWAAALDVLGVDAQFVPDLRPADSTFGTVNEGAPEILRGACVSVTGHDQPDLQLLWNCGRSRPQRSVADGRRAASITSGGGSIRGAPRAARAQRDLGCYSLRLGHGTGADHVGCSDSRPSRSARAELERPGKYQ
jgi:sugar (pentulose or hexulose) kinase